MICPLLICWSNPFKGQVSDLRSFSIPLNQTKLSWSPFARKQKIFACVWRAEYLLMLILNGSPWHRTSILNKPKSKVVKFNVVHFLHSIHCSWSWNSAKALLWERTWAERGNFSITPDFNFPYARYGKVFSSEGLILISGSYYSSKEVIDIAKRNGWKYKECSGESVSC